MYKRLYYLMLLVVLAGCEKDVDNAELLRVHGGIQFGFCVGYCKKEIRIQASNVAFIQGPTRDQTIPEKQCTINISGSEWQEIESLIEDAFFDLEEEYGCPDCSDQGEEWIEVVTSDRSHKVTFDPTLKVQIHPLVEIMRNWRKKAEEDKNCR